MKIYVSGFHTKEIIIFTKKHTTNALAIPSRLVELTTNDPTEDRRLIRNAVINVYDEGHGPKNVLDKPVGATK